MLNIFFYFFIVFFTLASQEPNFKDPLVIHLRSDDYAQRCISWLPDPINIVRCDITTDIALSTYELEYLIGKIENATISHTTLQTLCVNVAKKHKFQTITFSIKSEAGKQVLYISLEGFWTFRKLKIDGPMIGKDQFRQFYGIDTAEPFDIEKHQFYINHLKKVLRDEGFFSARVLDALDYCKDDKTIIVYIYIDPGTQYIIKKSCPVISCHETLMTVNLKRLEKKIYDKFTAIMSGEYYTQAYVEKKVQDIEDYLYKKGFFDAKVKPTMTLEPQRGEVFISYTVTISEYRECVFVGNRFFSRKDLMQQISSYRSSLHYLPISFVKDELVQLYHKKGFCFAKIKERQENDRWIFLIQEGNRALFERIELEGVGTFDTQALLKKFFPYSKKKYYDEQLFQDSLNDLINYYVQEGFWDARILYHTCTQDERNKFCVHVGISEGQRRYLSSISVIGVKEELVESLLKKIQTKLPIPLNQQFINEQRQQLSRILQKNGYLYATVKPIFYQQGDQVEIQWHVDLKTEPVTFGKTIIQGATHFPFERIKPHLPYKEGQVWSKEMLDEAVQRLRELGVFETVYVSPQNMMASDTKKPVIIKLVDDDPLEIRARVGIQQISKNLTFRTGTTYKVGGSVLYKNLLNHADFFRFDADVTRFFRYVCAAYCYPWMFDMPLNALCKLYSNKYTQPIVVGSNKRLYNATQQGGLIGLNYTMQRGYFGFNLGVELMETSGLSREFAQAINFEPTLIDKMIPYIFFEPSFFLERLDNKLNPTIGTLTAASCKGMYSWKQGSVNFFKFLAEQSFFVPIKTVVFAVRLRFGHIFNQKLRAIMPPERFFLGGANSQRGYEPDLAPPLGVIFEDGKRKLVPQGGRSMVDTNTEIRFPIFRKLGGVLFQDAGVLIENSLAEVMGSRIVASTGFGLRYNTPIGPLRFDLGIKWRRLDPDESRFAWFLTLGQAF